MVPRYFTDILGGHMKNTTSSDQNSQGEATLKASRRSFLKGSRLVLGAGLTLALGMTVRGTPAKADHNQRRDGDGGGGDGGGDGGDGGYKCFLPGTRIETPAGLVKIEELRIGDAVLTVSGEAKRIKFIGRRDLVRTPPEPWAGLGPVKIARFAIDGKAPHSDLYVSSAHAIYIDGILIPAGNLVNGVTIVADAKPEALSLTYFHIELDTHEVLLAEGLAVESLLRDNLPAFDNAGEHIRLYGSSVAPMSPFAPVVSYNGGRQELASHFRTMLAPLYDCRKPIDKVRDRIADRAECARPG